MIHLIVDKVDGNTCDFNTVVKGIFDTMCTFKRWKYGGVNIDNLIFIGLNIEICFMFAIAGIGFAKILPQDKNLKILGIPNRLFVAITGSAFCVIVEIWLNAIGALTWDFSWWSAGAPWLIFLLGYLPFFLVSFWVFDMEQTRKQAITVGIIYTVDIFCLILFGVILKWM